MLEALQRGYHHFMRNPLGEVIAAVLFVLASITGLFTGIGALLYILHLDTTLGADPFTRQLQMLQRLRGTRRVGTAFWLGLVMWVLVLLPNLQNQIMGIPLSWFIVQPIWLSLLIADRYDLSLSVALKATYHFTFNTPTHALQLYALGLIAFSGVICFGIGIFITLPIALFATLRLMEKMQRELSLAVQKAY